MEGNYGVYAGSKLVGKVQVLRRGLYYHFFCRCELLQEGIFRLHVQCGDTLEKLGVLIPENGGFGLNTKLPVKKLGGDHPHFTLLSETEKETTEFVPIYPDEPFAYIARIKTSFLSIQNGQPGIIKRAGTE